MHKGAFKLSGEYIVNPGKEEFVEQGGRRYACYAIQTSVVTAEDELNEVVKECAGDLLRQGDVLFISEKMVACAQGRAIPLDSIKPGFWARLLSRFVTRSSYGIGLSMPETMQCAINECGLFRILIAAVAGLFGKLFGKKGWFYIVAGRKAAAVDGPCDCTLPPYNHYVVPAPVDPDGAAASVSKTLGGNLVLIVDCNDFGSEILGVSVEGTDREFYAGLLKQNPLGQGHQRTPIGILRPVSA